MSRGLEYYPRDIVTRDRTSLHYISVTMLLTSKCPGAHATHFELADILISVFSRTELLSDDSTYPIGIGVLMQDTKDLGIRTTNVFATRKEHRRVIPRRGFNPASQPVKITSSCELSVAALHLALGRHIADKQKCQDITKSVFIDAVTAQRNGDAQRHARVMAEKPIDVVAPLSSALATASVSTASPARPRKV